MLESLQEKVRELQKENQELRMMVPKHIPEHAMKIISECCSDNVLFADPEENPDAQAQELVRADMSLMQSLAAGQKCFELRDTSGVGFGSYGVLHLRAAQRYPTHEHGFTLAHDCLTTALATSAVAHQNRRHPAPSHDLLKAQVLWAHGISQGEDEAA